MASINDRILRSTLRASIDLSRFEGTAKREVRTLLEKLRDNLVKELASKSNGRTDFNEARLQQTLKAAKEAINSTYGQIAKNQAVTMMTLASVQQKVAAGIINNAVGAVLIDTTFNAAQLRTLMSNMLVEGAPSAEWWARAAKGTREKFTDEMRQGMLRGETLDQLVARVQEPGIGLMETSTRQAEALVRTSVQTASNMIRQDVYQENADLFDGTMWVSTLDSRTTEECQALDGCMWDMDYNPIDGAPPYPGATAHWGCRSTQVPILKSWDKLIKDKDLAEKLNEAEAENPGTRASMGGQVPVGQKYEEWLKDQPVYMQRDILGPGKYEVWKDGKLPLRSMLDQSGNPLTLADIEARYSTRRRS